MKIYYVNFNKDIGPIIHITEFCNAFKKLNPDFKDIPLGKEGGSSESQATVNRKRTRTRKTISWLGHDFKSIFFDWLYSIKGCVVFLNKKPDIIILRHEAYASIFLLVSRLFRVPIVLEYNSPSFYEERKYDKIHFHPPLLLEFFDYVSLSLSTKISTVSDTLKQYIVSKFEIPSEKVFINHNGIDPLKFKPKIKSTHIMEKYQLHDSFTIGFIGTFQFWHGVENLIHVFKNIQREFPKCKLILVGSGPLLNRINSMIITERLHDSIITTGSVNHAGIPDLISVFDIAVLPCSHFYGSPLKIFEYMAMGKAVIAPDNGPMREIITHLEDGFLVNEDVLDMHKAVKRLIPDEKLRAHLGANARRTILTKFTWDMNAQRAFHACSFVYKKTRQKR